MGSDPNKMKMSKADVIEIILERLGYQDRRAEAVMIGDRNQTYTEHNRQGFPVLSHIRIWQL